MIELPDFLARMVRRYGWLFGVRMAVSGALLAALGFVGRAMFTSMFSISMGMNDFYDVTAYDNAGNVIDLGVYGLSAADLGSGGSPFGSPFGSATVSAMLQPAEILTGFFIGLGLVLLIGGAALAWYLKKWGAER